jgi:arylamine N-acetyltransferase
MAPLHTAPIFCCNDRSILDRFLKKYRINRNGAPISIIEKCAKAFSCIPYENLTKIIKSDLVLNPQSALRFPDEVIADHLKYGTGGTCFSLTAALIAVFNTLGFEAQPLLADRHYGMNTHCGLVVKQDNQMLLIDPGFLLFNPTPLPSATISIIDLEYITVELRPIDGGKRVELATTSNGDRKVRLTYKNSPVDAEAFKRAWIDSFTWEMMTYPVLTRSASGQHLYLQGASALIRTAEKTVRSRLDPSEQILFIRDNMGIAHDVVLKAWKVIRYGTN